MHFKLLLFLWLSLVGLGSAVQAGIVKPKGSSPNVVLAGEQTPEPLVVEREAEPALPPREAEIAEASRPQTQTTTQTKPRPTEIARPKSQAPAATVALPAASPAPSVPYLALKPKSKLRRWMDWLEAKAPKGHGAAVAGFVLGIVGLVFVLTVLLAPVGLILNIIGLVLSAFNLRERLGVAGFVLNLIGVILGLIFTGGIIVGASAS